MSPLDGGTAVQPCSPSMARPGAGIVPSPGSEALRRLGSTLGSASARRPSGGPRGYHPRSPGPAPSPLAIRSAAPREDPRVKIQEADAKSLLVAQGLPVPPWEVATSVAEARAAASRYLADGADALVIKAQVLVGGRGKAGGVKLARTAEEAEQVAGAILGMDIKGITVRKGLVGPAADIVKEYYLSAVLDRAARRILLMGSAEGGVEIEQVAAEHPEAIVRRHADPMLGLL